MYHKRMDTTTGTAAQHKTILLVEDDEALAGAYQARLELEGFTVMHVADGEEALATALRIRPDLVMLDVMMPQVNGFDVLDILRNTPETVNLRIIMLTALGEQSDKEKAQALGVDDYLVKSQITIDEIVQRIKMRLAAA